MAVNRYDTPAQAEFMNTYVPIPFEQMYKLGAQAKQDVDTALNTLSTSFDKWSDFRSPSEIDTEAFYNETIGKTLPTVEKLASNLDYLKTAAGRAELYSSLNNLDYAKLGKLQQSRDAMLAGQEYRAQLAAAGRYNPEWHDVDFANYSTLSQDIFSDISPVGYKSIQDLADPYVSSVKDSFLGSDGMYDYYGVTPEQIGGILDLNWSGIINTPEAQMHMRQQMAKNPGMTQADAELWLRNKAVQDTQQYARRNRTENRFALEDYKYTAARAAARKGAEDEAETPPATLTDQLLAVGQDTLLDSIVNNAGIFRHTSNSLNYAKSLKDATITAALARDARDLFKSAAGGDYNSVKPKNFQVGISEVLNSRKSNINSNDSDLILGAGARGTVDTPQGKAFLMESTKGSMLPSYFATNLMGIEGVNKDKAYKYAEQFEKDLYDGKFRNVTMQSTGDQFVYTENGEMKQATRVTVTIPYSELENRGYKDSWMNSVYFLRMITTPRESARDAVTDLEGGQVVEVPKADGTGTEKALRFDLIREIPQDGATRAFINQERLNSQVSTTYGSGNYQEFQAKSFDMWRSGNNSIY